MSKIFFLKRWLTVDESAKHMSLALGELVAKVDVLRLALDRKLKVSVEFINGATAKECEVVSADKVTHVASLLGSGTVPLGFQISEDEFLQARQEVVGLEGVFELAMFGGEALALQAAYQAEIGGPSITRTSINGVYVRRDDIIYQLVEGYDSAGNIIGSQSYTEIQIANNQQQQQWATDPEELLQAKSRLNEIEKQRATFVERWKDTPFHERFFPVSEMDLIDFNFVIEANHLVEVEERILRGVSSSSGVRLQDDAPPTWDGFDPADPYYPEELDIALQAWRAVSNRAPKDRYFKHLKEYITAAYPALKPAQVLRIARVCNWDRSGGRPEDDE